MADSRPVSSNQLKLLIAVANPEALPDSLLPIDVTAEIELLYHHDLTPTNPLPYTTTQYRQQNCL